MTAQTSVQSIRYYEGEWYGHGIVDLQVDHRGAWRQDLGGDADTLRGADFRFTLPASRMEPDRMSRKMHLAFDLSYIHMEGRWRMPGAWPG